MNLSDYFIKWLKSPYDVRNKTLEIHFNALIAGEYHVLALSDFMEVTAMMQRMAAHQEETTRRRMA